ncbi:MAG TPA: hypothetical protein VLG49_00700 [Rhabdochlamydiaceae bacterium]|nr:hypothetical protein [Rhabdochlamydiaceae bacterium]
MKEHVDDAICKKLKCKKNELRQAYFAANKDEGQQKEMDEWENTIDDGSDMW